MTSNYEQVHQKVLLSIKRRGEFGIRDLQRTFKIYDDDRSGQLNKEELKKGLQDYGLRLTQGGEMNDARKVLIKKAYSKLDKTGDGLVNMADIKLLYNARKHPKVESGEKTQEEVLKDFLNNFDRNKDGTLTYEEFEKYYAGISASIDNDAYFSLMIFNAWKL